MSGSNHTSATTVVDLVAVMRSQRSTFLREIATEVIPGGSVHRHIEANPALHQMYIVKIVESLPRVGKVEARRALEALGVDELAPAITVDEDTWGLLLAGVGV
jgi:hypothetical protein